MKYWILTWFTPGCWLQNHRLSREWDKQLRSLIAVNRFQRTNEYHTHIGGITLWIANHPYASFATKVGGNKIRPHRRTILWAYAILEAQVFEDAMQGAAQQPETEEGEG